MALPKIPVSGTCFQTEQSSAQLPVSITSVTITGGVATVTAAAAHGLVAGNTFTFSGSTGVTGLNGTTWTVQSVSSTTVFTFLTSLAGTVAGTIVLDPVLVPSNGIYNVTVGANAVVQYNPDNTGIPQNSSTGNVTGATWRTLVAASSSGSFTTDGYGIRILCNGTTGTTYWSEYS